MSSLRISRIASVTLVSLASVTALTLSACAQSPSPAPGPVTLGSEADARWTPTTEEAATKPEQKDWLKRGKTATITGEIVDVSCYLQLGKRGPAHVECGRKCVTAGQPGGLLDAKGDLYLLVPEQHHPRRDGGVSLRTWIASHMGAQATISGVLNEEKGQRALFVQAPPTDATPLPETIPHTTPAADSVPAPSSSADTTPAAETPPTTSPLPSATPSPLPDIVSPSPAK